jgi:quinol-cytochrome oxidoreductase complex cytochrome b subunit
VIVVLERGASGEEVRGILASLASLGLEAREISGGGRSLVHVVRGPTRRARKLLAHGRVVALVPTSGPRIRREGRRFYPYHFIGWCAAALVASGVLVLLAGVLPPGLGPSFDALDPPAPAAAPLPWYLLPARGLSRLLPDGLRWVGGLAVLLVLALLVALPFVDRAGRARWTGGLLALVLLGSALALGVIGAGA